MRGRQALEKELERLSADMSFETVARLFKYDELEDFLAAIGYGDINSQHIATKVLEFERREQERLSPLDFFAFNTSNPGIGSGVDFAGEGLRVQGVEGLLTNLGKCCNPVPGDEIIGYVTKGRGVTIHRRNCPNMSRVVMQGSGRLLEVTWTATKQERTYPVKIQVSAYDRSGLVRDVAGLVADQHVNMRNIEAVTGQKDNLAVISATLEIQDIAQLTRIMTKIERLPNIQTVRRKLG
jgi:GTP pyrophosphokinase